MPHVMHPSPGRTETWVQLDPLDTLPPAIGEAALQLGRSKAMHQSYLTAANGQWNAAADRAIFWGHDETAWEERLKILHKERQSSSRDIRTAQGVTNVVFRELFVSKTE